MLPQKVPTYVESSADDFTSKLVTRVTCLHRSNDEAARLV